MVDPAEPTGHLSIHRSTAMDLDKTAPTGCEAVFSSGRWVCNEHREPGATLQQWQGKVGQDESDIGGGVGMIEHTAERRERTVANHLGTLCQDRAPGSSLGLPVGATHAVKRQLTRSCPCC